MPVTQTGRNVESLVTELSDARKQLDEIPARFQGAIDGLLASIGTELAAHRDRFIGVLRAEQSEAAKLRKDNAAQQQRIEELLADLGRARLDLVRAGRSSLSAGSRQQPGELDAPSGSAEPEPEPEARAVDREDLASAPTGTGGSVPGPAPEQTTITTSAEESDMTESTPQPDTEDVPPAVRDYIRQLPAEQPHATSAPRDPAVGVPTAPKEALAVAAEAPSRSAGGGTSDLIPPALAWPAHVATLRKAAAVNKLAVACHPHTWDFLADRVRAAGGKEHNPHFTDPAGADRDQRRDWDRSGADSDKHPDTVLSGRSAVALLNALHTMVHQGLDPERGIETWALAVTAYERIAEVVNATRPGTHVPDGPDSRPRVVLDDRSLGAEH
ncbi:hypothetical protein ACFQ6N_25165 [Kitasatospora sp. NPDC056446]|uniref:hypothetical protein n=1 Tax=Kitasatospora sp. NPDC056446 TaxID=3345819 RepID=UPI0036820243